jgi:hypothetical protein
MAFTETYHCDVCGNPRGDAEDWWLAMTEPASLIPTAPEQPMLKLTQWNILLSHAAKVRRPLRPDPDGPVDARGVALVRSFFPGNCALLCRRQ